MINTFFLKVCHFIKELDLDSKKKIKHRYLVSLNTARIKLRKKHPRISQDLDVLLGFLKTDSFDCFSEYQEDGLLNLKS